MLIWAGWAQILIIIRSNSAGFAEKVFVHNFWDKFGVVLALAYVLLPFYLKLDVIKKPD
jgi:cytochrome c oxidase subunit IV